MKTKPRLTFGTPAHGWMSVTLQLGTITSELVASDVPGDSLEMLVSAVLQIATGAEEASVTWFLEPAEITWSFLRTEAEVEIQLSERGVKTESETLDAHVLYAVVWRALRRLQTNPCWETADTSRIWSHPFPDVATEELGMRILREE